MGISLEKFRDSFEKGGGKGGRGTHQRAAATWVALDRFAQKNGWKNFEPGARSGTSVHPGSITTKQIRSFIEHRSTQISARSAQNEASHIRRACRGSGRDVGDLRDKKDNWSAARLAVPSGSRIGGKAAANPEVLARAIQSAPRDISVALSLCQAIGLRRQESVMASASLKDWSRCLSAGKEDGRGAFLAINHGTKGGFERLTFIPAYRVDQVIEAVEDAIVHTSTSKGGFVIEVENPGEKPLKQALCRMSNACTKLELVGGNSCHGARRLFAHDQFDHYKETGFSDGEALAKLSNDLGHGDGRGRWVWNNYLLGGRG